MPCKTYLGEQYWLDLYFITVFIYLLFILYLFSQTVCLGFFEHNQQTHTMMMCSLALVRWGKNELWSSGIQGPPGVLERSLTLSVVKHLKARILSDGGPWAKSL